MKIQKSKLNVPYLPNPDANTNLVGTPTTIQFTLAELLDLMQLQDEANTAMSSELWRDTTNSELWYYRAAGAELYECLTHIGIKWWKNEHPTDEILESAKAQADMEVVDVLHFSLSDVVRDLHKKGIVLKKEGSFKYPELLRIGRFAGRTDEILYSQVSVLDFIEQTVFVLLRDGFIALDYVVVLAEYLGFNSESLFKSYFTKNVLNKFRTDNGQREGNYFKIWGGKEDNEFLSKYIELGGDLNISSVTAYLSKEYLSHMERGLVERA